MFGGWVRARSGCAAGPLDRAGSAGIAPNGRDPVVEPPRDAGISSRRQPDVARRRDWRAISAASGPPGGDQPPSGALSDPASPSVCPRGFLLEGPTHQPADQRLQHAISAPSAPRRRPATGIERPMCRQSARPGTPAPSATGCSRHDATKGAHALPGAAPLGTPPTRCFRIGPFPEHYRAGWLPLALGTTATCSPTPSW